MDDAIPLFFRIAGLLLVKENLESHGICDFNFQAWKVMEFMISIYRPGKSWIYDFNFQAWEVMEFMTSISRPGKSWNL